MFHIRIAQYSYSYIVIFENKMSHGLYVWLQQLLQAVEATNKVSEIGYGSFKANYTDRYNISGHTDDKRLV